MSTDLLPRRGSVWQFRHGNRGLVDVVAADGTLVTIRYRNTGHVSTTMLGSFRVMYDPSLADPLPDSMLDSEATS